MPVASSCSCYPHILPWCCVFLVLALNYVHCADFSTDPISWSSFVAYHSITRSSRSSGTYAAFTNISSLQSLAHRRIEVNERLWGCEKSAVGGYEFASKTNDSGHPPCWNTHFLGSWATNIVSKRFCDENATSNVQCVDSTLLGVTSRVCTFDNVLLDFSKMRTKPRSGRSPPSRSWEQGFISVDCDVPTMKDDSTANIGYFPMYNPSIQWGDEAQCDMQYDGTVILYSHYDIRVLAAVMNDLMNIWTMLWLTGNSEVTRKLGFMNVDALRPERPNGGDDLHNYQDLYERIFQRVMRASDFEGKTLCVKRLIMQPRYEVNYQYENRLPINSK